MSRLAKKSIKFPEGVTIREESGTMILEGPKGELKVPVLPFTEVKSEDGSASVSSSSSVRQARANLGTMWSLVKNASEGVFAGFSKILEIEGIGYRANLEGKNLMLSLGYVKPVKFEIPEGISITTEKNVITVSGIDKQLVGETAARIRKLKKPEPYKGKGIKYKGEIIRRKAGKKVAATAG
ncbi:MAG: 50S ribosomal protein L6 [Candidatus Liptonbacteria bacterium]|nr:50S ribosomal protein L6 [Candidatus Liptonbacteria bacterium]